MTFRLIAASALALALSAGLAQAQSTPIALDRIEAAVTAGTPRVVAWRRDLHANPELGFAETRTAAMVLALKRIEAHYLIEGFSQ